MPLRRRLVSEETMDIIINSEVAQVLGRILMLPLAITKEILKHLDTKLLTHDIYSDHGPNSQIPFMTWTGTQRMQNRARLRRRMGQRGWHLTLPIYQILDFTQNGWTVPDFPF